MKKKVTRRARPRWETQKRRVSHHEAGHIVFAHVLGVVVRNAMIAPRRGLARGNDGSSEFAASPDLDESGYTTIKLAGPVAEMLCNDPTDPVLTSQNLQVFCDEAADIVDAIGEANYSLVMAASILAARAVWPGVEAVAALLEEKVMASGEEIIPVINAALENLDTSRVAEAVAVYRKVLAS